MQFHADSLVLQGSGHLEIGCQDYAKAGIENGIPYVIICDGCSGSKDSDFGARILASLAYKDIIGNSNIPTLLDIQEYLDLEEMVLDATLLLAFIKDNKLSIEIYGDGVIIVEDKDNFIIRSFNYSSGYPYYLSYEINSDRLNNYKKLSENHTYTEDLIVINKKDLKIIISKIDYNFDYRPTIQIDLLNNPISNITLCSDGVNSFTRKFTLEKISLVDLYKDLFIYPNTTGMFLKRKGLLLNKKMTKEGFYHFDDLSIAAISIK